MGAAVPERTAQTGSVGLGQTDKDPVFHAALLDLDPHSLAEAKRLVTLNRRRPAAGPLCPAKGRLPASEPEGP